MAIQANRVSAGARSLTEMLPMALSLLETMPGGAVLLDTRGAVAGINSAARRMFGVKAREVLGRVITELYPDSQWQSIIRTGLPSGAHRMSVGDGQQVRMELPVFAEGRVVAVLAHFMSREVGLLREILPKLPGEDQGPVADKVPLAAPPQAETPAEVPPTLADIVGHSGPMREARVLAGKAAKTDMPVLICSEAGCGAGDFARVIHASGARASGELVVLSCRVVQESLLMDDVFGVGAAEGAMSRPGKLELAVGGTLFLEEIDQMPLSVQGRLIQAIIESGRATNGSAGLPRLIAATRRDLATLVAEGGFREDLYYRLNVIRLVIPPLRTRPEDVKVLVEHHLRRLNRLYADQGLNKGISQACLEMLLRYSWPGNAAELESVISRAYCVSDGGEILPRHLPLALKQISQVPTEAVGQKTLEEIVAEVERGVIMQALRATGHNKSRTARLLGLPRSSFYEKLARYGLMGRTG